MVEWNLYAIVMSENFGWSATEAGAGQMAGDLLGAIVLFMFARVREKKQGSGDEPTASPYPVWMRIPLNNGFLIIAMGGLLMAMASPDMLVCALGQIGMGTLYVLSLQLGTEMAVLYGLDNSVALHHHISTNYVAFNMGLLAAAAITLPLYEVLDEVPVLLGGGLLLVVGGILWLIFFGQRGELAVVRVRVSLHMCARIFMVVVRSFVLNHTPTTHRFFSPF
jgi:hypothetical protein